MESFLRSLIEELGGEQDKRWRIILKEVITGFSYVNLWSEFVREMTVNRGVSLSINLPVTYKAGNIFYNGSVCLLLELDSASLSYADCFICVCYTPELYFMLFLYKGSQSVTCYCFPDGAAIARLIRWLWLSSWNFSRRHYEDVVPESTQMFPLLSYGHRDSSHPCHCWTMLAAWTCVYLNRVWSSISPGCLLLHLQYMLNALPFLEGL